MAIRRQLPTALLWLSLLSAALLKPARVLQPSVMKLGITLTTLAGLSTMIALLVYNDALAIFGLVASVGWGLAWVVFVRASILVIAGIGWAKLVQPFAQVALRVYLQLRWIRESVNVLLPVAQVGGDLLGGRLLTFWHVSGGLAGASILVDPVIQLGAQFAFTLIGLAVLALSGADARLVEYVAGGLTISAAALAGFYYAQRSGLMRIAENLLIRVARRRPSFTLGRIPALHENLQAIYRQPRALLSSFVLHQAAWFLGAGEIWIALTCIGLRPGLGECLVLESLGQAVRSADFAVPGVMGVQEGGFLVIGSFYGIGPEISLALSLVKRIPDVALGVPGLLVWHSLELRHARAYRRARAPGEALRVQGRGPEVLREVTTAGGRRRPDLGSEHTR